MKRIRKYSVLRPVARGLIVLGLAMWDVPPAAALRKPEKSRPGKYSDSVKDPGGTDRISSHCLIQFRACSGLVTANAPYEPALFRIRHQSRLAGWGGDEPYQRGALLE